MGVGVGMMLASLLFMKRMAEVSEVAWIRSELDEGSEPQGADPLDPGTVEEKRIRPGIEVFEINGPFFFGIADKLKDTLNQFERPPAVFILRMRYVPHIDATGLHALHEFLDKCRRQGTRLLLGGVHARPLFELQKSGLLDRIGADNVFDSLDAAIHRANELLSPPDEGPPASDAPK
jgi:SulP family sulfate permease